jgi:hypothetical protein
MTSNNNFASLSFSEIVARFDSLVDNGTVTDIDDAFAALEHATPIIRLGIATNQEVKMIEQAKLALGDDPARLMPTIAQVLLHVSRIRGDLAQKPTRLFVKEFFNLSARDKKSSKKLAACFAAITGTAEEVAAPAAVISPSLAFDNQMKLKPLAARFKARLIP